MADSGSSAAASKKRHRSGDISDEEEFNKKSAVSYQHSCGDNPAASQTTHIQPTSKLPIQPVQSTDSELLYQVVK